MELRTAVSTENLPGEDRHLSRSCWSVPVTTYLLYSVKCILINDNRLGIKKELTILLGSIGPLFTAIILGGRFEVLGMSKIFYAFKDLFNTA